jgi:hypothetical protein
VARELRMPLGQRIAHVPPERRRRIRDLRGELHVGLRLVFSRGKLAGLSGLIS